MTGEQHQILQEQDPRCLALWWCQINNGTWPKDLPDEADPDDHARRWEIMCWISQKIGLKICLRMWNSENMSDEEFERFWAGQTSAGGKLNALTD
jgi:hypothetical protein